MQQSTRKLGNKFESIAAAYLKRQGLSLLHKNYICRLGEIDLIMLSFDSLVFVEVRYRQSEQFGTAQATVSNAKQRKIIRTAQFFLQTNQKYKQYRCRFDVIGITKTVSCYKIRWIPGAFRVQ